MLINRASQILDQINVLNSDFSSSGITWVLANTTRTVNPDWFDNVGSDSDDDPQTDMKKQLRTGGAADLNVYTVGYCCHSEVFLSPF